MLNKTITKLPTPKAIVFDWDNTLVDAWTKMMKCTNQTFAAFAKDPLTLHDMKDSVHLSAKDAFPKIFGADSDKARALYYDLYLNVYASEIPQPLAGVEDMLKHIKSLGIYTAVLSNKKGAVLRDEVTAHGYDKYFNKIVGSTDAAEDKPSLLALKLALGEIKPDADVWFVGDTEVDMLCANNAGCTKIFYGDGQTTFDAIRINSYQEFINVHDKT
ncbi:MAG: HAD family hydrolase [Rickettsiales bacterium]